MANEDLRSELSRLEREISQQERENAILRGQINDMLNALSYAANTTYSECNNYIGGFQRGTGRVITSHDAVGQAIYTEEFSRYILGCYKNIENAYKNIRKCNNDKRSKFASVNVVNRHFIAALQNSRNKMVSDATALKEAEKLNLQSKDYYLSYLMIQIASYLKNGVDTPDKYIAAALEINPKYTVAALALINIYSNHDDAAAVWLEKLLQYPIVGADSRLFSVLLSLKFYAPRPKIMPLIDKYFEGATRNTDTDYIKNKLFNIFKNVPQVHTPTFDKLANAAVVDYPKLASVLQLAANNGKIGEKIDHIANKQKSGKKSFFDNAVESYFLSCTSPAVDELDRDISYNECVIKSSGLMEDAQVLDATRQTRKVSALDGDRIMFNILLDQTAYDIKEQLSAFIYKRIDSIVLDCFREYRTAYLNARPKDIGVKIEYFEGRTAFINSATDYEAIDKACDNKAKERLAAIKITPIIIFALLCVLSIGLAFAHWACAFALILLVPVTAYFIFNYISRRKQVIILTNEDRVRIKAKFDTLKTEYDSYVDEFTRFDIVREKVESIIKGIQVDQTTAA